MDYYSPVLAFTSYHTNGLILPATFKDKDHPLLKRIQLESVKAWMADPKYGSLPLYTRIQRGIRQLILNGALVPGSPLPATRELAKSLGVSRDTAEAAYALLHTEGLIQRYIGSGSFVARMSSFSTLTAQTSKNSFANLKNPELSQRGLKMSKGGVVREYSSSCAFIPGEPETQSFPIKTWSRLQRQVLNEFGASALAHGDPQGNESLRSAIADYINLERGARATADRILILTSSQQSMALCSTMLLDKGDSVCIEDPAYFGAQRVLDASGAVCIPIPVDSEGMQVDVLLQKGKKAKASFVTPSHQFPTGVTLTLERRLKLIDWAKTHRSWIVEDDYDSEFHYAGKPVACMQGLDNNSRTIYIGTFTKSLFPGLRIGYVVLPPELVSPFTVGRTLMDGHTATISQLTLARFIEEGHFGTHIRSMRNLYARRLEVLSKLITKHLSEYVEPQIPSGGLQMPCILKTEHSEVDLVIAAKRNGVEIMGLSKLYATPTQQAGFLMGFAAYTEDEMTIGIKKLAKAFKSVRHRK